MKAKISKGSGFRGALNYLLGGGRGEIIGGNMAGKSQAELSAEYGAVRCQRPDVKRPVWHCSLSLPIGDNLSVEQWREIAADFCRKMDIKDNQYCIIRHDDKQHKHIHILLNRITPDGAIWYADRDVFRAIEACRQLEQAKAYLRDTSSWDNTSRKYYPTKREEGRRRKGQDVTRQIIHDTIRRVIDDAPRKLTPQEFIERLRAEGIAARPNVASTGRINGFSFSQRERKYTGSKVGAKWAQLRQQIDYQASRDNAYLMAMVGRKPQDMAFSPAEFDRYMTVLDKFIKNPTLAVDLRDEIRHIGVSRLTHGIKELNNAHYQQLSELYSENKKVWQKIRSQRPPMRLTSRDMTAAAVMFALSPVLGALVVLPYALDKLLRHSRKAQAADIAKQISELKAEVIKNNQRRDILKELRTENRKFREDIQNMRADEREIIMQNVKNQIDRTAKQDKDFRGYIDYINQSGIREIAPTYDELATLYQRDAWQQNDAVLRGTADMLAAATTAIAEKPENRAIYILPIVFDAISRVKTDDRLDGQTLEIAIKEFKEQGIAQQYIHAELKTEQAEERQMLADTRERTDELRRQIRRINIAEQPLPEARINKWTKKVTLTPEEYERLMYIYEQFEKMQVAYYQAESEKFGLVEENKKLAGKNSELEHLLSDYGRAINNMKAGRDKAEERAIGLSAEIEQIHTYMDKAGLEQGYADWLTAKAKIEQQMKQITQRLDYDGGMEM